MNKVFAARIIVILAGAAAISGCAPMLSGAMNASLNENAVFEKTAKYLGAPREQITISSIEKSALTTSYQAQYDGNIYNCSIYYGDVTCKHVRAATKQAAATSAETRPSPAEAAPMTAAQAQARLNDLGYPVGTPDGIFGKKSTEKLKLFQKARGLKPTGTLDEPTVAALR